MFFYMLDAIALCASSQMIISRFNSAKSTCRSLEYVVRINDGF